ncbi:hypothetical protein FRC19_010432 [Serendipita sp. 401]|nr:hypothetical protein FRC19_010432 [Serendipita sp. 401]KAG9056489.1 hypothetical protein FS842_010527 [Serendipita sp. 407]
MSIQQIDVGIVFRPLETGRTSSGSSMRAIGHGPPNDPGSVKNRAFSHWILIFSTSSGSLQVELDNQYGTIVSQVRAFPHKIRAHNFAQYTGTFEDIRYLSDNHPMNGDTYSKTKNNCQHWAAHFLNSLRSYGDNYPPRNFRVTNYAVYEIILSVWKVTNMFKSRYGNVRTSYTKVFTSALRDYAKRFLKFW